MSEAVLVTGASGFVGLPLVQALAAQGWTVHAQACHAPGPAMQGVSWHLCNLLDCANANKLIDHIAPSHLVHAAWNVEHGKYWDAPENAAWLHASTALATQFFNAGGRRFVGIGSCAEYAWRLGHEDVLPWPESRIVDPASRYGQAKAMLAQRLADMAQAQPARQVAWARLFHLFGAQEQPARLVPAIMRALLRGELAHCSSGRQIRDFASTDWVATALAALLRSKVTGAVNVGSGSALSIAALAEKIARLAGHPELLRLGSLPDRLDDLPVMVADTTRLRAEVGFVMPMDLEAALHDLIARHCELNARQRHAPD